MRANLSLALAMLLITAAMGLVFQRPPSRPAGAGTGTPLYLPVVFKPATPTPSATQALPTSTSTATATPTEPSAPAALSITSLSGTTAPEYVTITNSGGSAQVMTGWSLVSIVGPQTYNFPAGFTLGPGASVHVQSYDGAVHSPPSILLWSPAAIWANAGDKAELRDASNSLIDSECYLNGCP